LLVYRDTSKRVLGSRLVEAIAAELSGSRILALPALLRAGQLESGLSDIGDSRASAAIELTDLAARRHLGAQARAEMPGVWLERLRELPELSLTEPEGYAYYALDPMRYAELARDWSRAAERPVVVLGIRSIGTSLSALVKAQLELEGVPVSRCTVRPQGHPWQRKLVWSAEQLSCLAGRIERSDFIVVDEGPGLSGSTLLSVAEALEAIGVSRSRITLFCAHAPDPARLLAPGAAGRWARYEVRAARPWTAPEAARDISAGAWRARLYASEQEWPCSWVQSERLKYLSPDGRTLHKFCGYPPYDEAILSRATELFQAGWSPRLSRHAPGFLSSTWHDGRPAAASCDRARALPRLAEYAAFRTRAFAAAPVSVEPLSTMARLNVSEALALDLPQDFGLEVVNPVFADARMMPHEWLVMDGERLLKTDSADHAEDHFYPGVTDIAWDLAGAIVEWDLDSAHSAQLAAQFHALTSDDPRPRLPAYIAAYVAFRIGFVELGALSSSSSERARLSQASTRYRVQLRNQLRALARSH
jgi:hypothetical protein